MKPETQLIGAAFLVAAGLVLWPTSKKPPSEAASAGPINAGQADPMVGQGDGSTVFYDAGEGYQ